ncbi:CHC2 zinc finger domain-containing protein [Clostridium sp. CT7]|nr:CHC2 zinc finger domain-containing protein [Clostridium sp. CT7]
MREEKTASFNISLEKNLWYDFGISKGGSDIDLIMEIEHCDEKEAIKK